MAALERTLFRVEVAETSRNREYWATRKWVGPVRQGEIRAADVIVAPWEDFREGHEVLFPQGTTSYLQKFTEKFPARRIVIAIEREYYQEIALHAQEWRLPTLLISSLLLPVLANVVAAQINTWISCAGDESTVQLEVIVENDKGRCISIRYYGPPDRLAETLVEQANRCFPHASSGSTSEAER